MKKVQVWKTSKDKMNFSFCNEMNFQGNKEATKLPEININDEEEYQEIIGFGGAFGEIGWEAIKHLNEENKNVLFNELFTKEGCNFTLCRTPIGANDFALDAYSLNDVKDDYEMVNFSIERDKERLIPYIKESLKINPEIKIWSCPWSPSYWMKTTGEMCCGGELLDEPKVLRAYAKYLVKYIQAYREEGIEIYGFCVQNETDVINVYPTSTMTPEMMKKFMRAYLIPELVRMEGRAFKTELWAGTIRNVKGYAHEVVTEPGIRELVTGIGFQYSSAEVVSDSYNKYPGIKLLHTEAPCHNGSNSWEEAEDIFKDIVCYLESGCTNYSYWNMVLDETGFSTWNWKQNSMINVDREKGEIIYNPEFYVMKHFSHFIMPGAKRIKSSGGDDEKFIAFKNPDESIICVLCNFTCEKKSINIYVDGKSFEQTLDPESFYTLKIEK